MSLEAYWLGVPLALVGIFAIWFAWQRGRLRRSVESRLSPQLLEPEPERPVLPVARPRLLFPQRTWLAWCLAVLAGLSVYLVSGQTLLGSVAGLVVGMLGTQALAWWRNRKLTQLETQLGEAVDLLVGALQAGAGVLQALETILPETRAPLQVQLEEVLGRIKLGDNPQVVFRMLATRVPLESFRLFSSALSAHWRAGGNLAPTLGTVGAAIRDRLEIQRRVHSLTTEARFSVFIVMGMTYFIAFLMWYTDPPRMIGFLTSTFGRWLVSFAVLFQAIGLAWSSALSRIRV